MIKEIRESGGGDEEDPFAHTKRARIIDREDEYRKRRMDQVWSLEANIIFIFFLEIENFLIFISHGVLKREPLRLRILLHRQITAYCLT